MTTSFDPVHRVATAGFTITLALFLAGPPSAAQPTVKDPNAFEEIGIYLLHLDGEEVPARFFHSAGLARILMVSPELTHSVELEPRTRSLVLYSSDDYVTKIDGSRQRDDSAAVTGRGSFELVGTLPQFSVEGRQAQILRKPPLLGAVDREGLIAYDIGYKNRGEAYRAHPAHLERIRAYEDPVRVRIYFGSWCPLCFQVLPNIVKLESELAGAAVEFEYYGLPQGAQDPEAQKDGVESVPTGIVYSNGEEIGRIEGVRWRYPDLSLSNALRGLGTRKLDTHAPP